MAQMPINSGVSHTFDAAAKAYFEFRSLFSGFRNLPYREPPDSEDLNQVIQQEAFIPGFLYMLDNRKEPLPLFLLGQATFTQYDQSRMNGRLEKFD